MHRCTRSSRLGSLSPSAVNRSDAVLVSLDGHTAYISPRERCEQGDPVVPAFFTCSGSAKLCSVWLTRLVGLASLVAPPTSHGSTSKNNFQARAARAAIYTWLVVGPDAVAARSSSSAACVQSLRTAARIMGCVCQCRVSQLFR